jgi:hypothetical protein
MCDLLYIVVARVKRGMVNVYRVSMFPGYRAMRVKRDRE